MFEGPLQMEVTAYYSIPQSASKKKAEMMRECKLFPTKKPDCDNVLKIIADALNGIAYKDDSQIVVGIVRKVYADVPKVVVGITSMTQ